VAKTKKTEESKPKAEELKPEVKAFVPSVGKVLTEEEINKLSSKK
jgi:hypothetical protein